jgi:hypothetical protein
VSVTVIDIRPHSNLPSRPRSWRATPWPWPTSGLPADAQYRLVSTWSPRFFGIMRDSPAFGSRRPPRPAPCSCEMRKTVSNRLTYMQMHHPLEAVTTTGRGGVAGVVSVSTGRHGGLRGCPGGQREKMASMCCLDSRRFGGIGPGFGRQFGGRTLWN